jgi:phosphosulfolactate phosphohydrolase-like enzyme
MNRKLTLFDMPKPFLVGIIEALGFPVDDAMIAGAIIQHRLNRAEKHAGQFNEITAAAKRTRQMRRRRDLEIQAQRHAVNSTILFESARELAERYNLKEKYFKNRKKKAGAANTGH